MLEASAALTGLMKSGRLWKIDTVALAPRPPSQTTGSTNAMLRIPATVLRPKSPSQPAFFLSFLPLSAIESRLPSIFERNHKYGHLGIHCNPPSTPQSQANTGPLGCTRLGARSGSYQPRGWICCLHEES